MKNTYKETFLATEKTFRPRNKYTHKEVIDCFSSLFDSADNDIAYYKEELKEIIEEYCILNKQYKLMLYSLLTLMFVVGGICYLVGAIS